MSASGQCLCGAIKVNISGDLPPGVACHCSQCRKQSGHFWASIHVPRSKVTIHEDGALTWYNASEFARRGFCINCGSMLFWDPADEDKISISLGILEAPTGTKLAQHIFTEDKGDYYDLSDGLKQS